PLLLLVVVGGIGSAGGALFAGLVLYGIPLVSASFAWFENIGRVLPGLMGLGLGQNPNGVVPDVEVRFAPLRHARVVLAALAVALGGLVLAVEAGVIDKWRFALAVVGVIVVAGAVADRHRLLGEDGEPLEWIGVDRPFTPDDVRRLDAHLGLQDASAAGAAR